MSELLELVERITNYLSNGGLFNPEYVQHSQVRDLLIDCRAALSASPGTQGVSEGQLQELLMMAQGWRNTVLGPYYTIYDCAERLEKWCKAAALHPSPEDMVAQHEKWRIVKELNRYVEELQGDEMDPIYQAALKLHNAGFELAHESARCGHARANYRDPNYKRGDAECDSSQCEFCNALAALHPSGQDGERPEVEK